MAYETKPESGSLFKNQYKEDPEDRKPDMTGKCLIDGKEWRIAGWWNEPRGGGDEYLSLKFSEPQQGSSGGGGGYGRGRQEPQAPTRRMSEADFQKRREEANRNRVPYGGYRAPPDNLSDDDIPF